MESLQVSLKIQKWTKSDKYWHNREHTKKQDSSKIDTVTNYIIWLSGIVGRRVV